MLRRSIAAKLSLPPIRERLRPLIRKFAGVLVEFRQQVGASRVRVFHQFFRDEKL